MVNADYVSPEPEYGDNPDESWEDLYSANNVSTILDGSNPGRFGNRFYERPKPELTRDVLGAAVIDPNVLKPVSRNIALETILR